jgi:hypothetical protein
MPAMAAQAQTYPVTNLNDTGPGSLRDAIDQASNLHSSTGADVITFQSGLSGAIHLASPLPPIFDDNGLDIVGPGARVLTLDASGIPSTSSGPVISQDAPLTISGLAMDNAHSNSYGGGFILGYGSSQLTLDADSFTNDSAPSGGAVFAYDGDLVVRDSTFSGDKATAGSGGAIDLVDANAAISNSTIDGNAATQFGGGVAATYSDHSVTITDSTITGNAVSYTGTQPYPAGYGGGVAATYGPAVVLQDSIVAGNSASGNPNLPSPAHHRDVFVGAGASLSAKFSLIQNDTDGLALDTTDITGKDPLLGPLQNNGGVTDTRLPALSSPAVDQGNAFGLTTDQRGLPRPMAYPGVGKPVGGDGSDIGAVEVQPPPVVSRLSSQSGVSGTQVTISGQNLADATGVSFGTATASFTPNSDGSLTATVPSGSGTVDVTVTGPGGRSATGSADRFTFAAPAISESKRVSARWHGSAVVVNTGITVSCPAGGPACRSELTGQAVVPARLPRMTNGRRTRELTVVRATVATNPGQHQQLTFKLTGKSLRALKRLHLLRITIAVTVVDAADTTSLQKTITVRLPKRHGHGRGKDHPKQSPK